MNLNVCFFFNWNIFICRLGSYEITEAEGVQRGTKIVIHLKGDSYDFAKEDHIKGNSIW